LTQSYKKLQSYSAFCYARNQSLKWHSNTLHNDFRNKSLVLLEVFAESRICIVMLSVVFFVMLSVIMLNANTTTAIIMHPVMLSVAFFIAKLVVSISSVIMPNVLHSRVGLWPPTLD
jgi:hypothetical protein